MTIVDVAPQRVDNGIATAQSPDLGITPKMDVLGKRAAVGE